MSVEKQPKKFLLMAGGTGGHVFPALALARKLKDDGFSVEWIGSEGGFEAPYVQAENIPLHSISIKGLRGKGALSWLKAPLKLVRAIAQARKVVKKIKPDCVVGMGGFAAGPGGIAAWMSGTPLLIHEQNAVAGVTNRVLFYFSKRVLQAFPNAFGKQNEKLRTTGNPVRKELTKIAEYEERKSELTGSKPIHLLVLGGSQGAASINQTVPVAIKEMGDNPMPDIWHQAGRGKDQETRTLYEEMGVDAKVECFIDDMAAAYAWADLVICRAGALTIAELSAVGVASVLVPYPHAVDDHQTMNAEYLQSVGAAIVVQQKDMDKTSLGKLISQFCADPQQLKIMAGKARSVAMPDAVDRVEQYCIELLQ